ncbi:D-glycerate dehydrogenase [Neobacillus mesonae]|uniref:2-hydroxyacid dehydrogenase n=1 Tax=Neobacillus mesonae TaxID=1193713 RepID=UPI002040CE5B|nr:D-glycerate dehydrogenase [Neobacillus mesonae]MCM3567588.1 D-glycerate dehydrogenase [Neobacillus mesonae]
MKPYVYITRKLPEAVIKPLTQQFNVNMWEDKEEPVPKEVLLEEAKKADALLTMLPDVVDENVFSVGEKLKIVANMAVGYDNVDIEAATRYGIAVCNTPDVLTDATADLTFALLMASARRLEEAARFIKEDRWKNWNPYLLIGHDIHHKTIGILGMGKIGEAVAKRAAGFDMNILYHNRSRKPETEQQLGAKYVSFEELIEQSDFVVCLTPLTEETRNMITLSVFKKMKQSAIFVNASRGPVVNEQDLVEALKTGEIAGAGLDVFEKEPIRHNHPLLKLDNVVALPHIGSSTIETRTAMMKVCVDNIEAVLTGKPPITLVNKAWQNA